MTWIKKKMQRILGAKAKREILLEFERITGYWLKNLKINLQIQYVEGSFSVDLSISISLHLLTSPYISLHRFCRDLLSHGLFQAGAEPAANATRQVSCFLPVDVHSACRTSVALQDSEYAHHISRPLHHLHHLHHTSVIIGLSIGISCINPYHAGPVIVVLALVRAYCRDALARCGLVVTKFSSSQRPSDHPTHFVNIELSQETSRNIKKHQGTATTTMWSWTFHEI